MTFHKTLAAVPDVFGRIADDVLIALERVDYLRPAKCVVRRIHQAVVSIGIVDYRRGHGLRI